VEEKQEQLERERRQLERETLEKQRLAELANIYSSARTDAEENLKKLKEQKELEVILKSFNERYGFVTCLFPT
jgi:hypothetical protein